MDRLTPSRLVPESDAGAVRAMLRYAVKALRPEVLALASGEDGVAAVAHGVLVFQFVPHAQALQGADSAQEIAQAGDVDAAVQHPAIVAHADHHGVAPAIAAGLGFDGRKYLLIVGAWVCPLDELRLHGSFSGCDVAMLVYAAKYLRAAGTMADVI